MSPPGHLSDSFHIPVWMTKESGFECFVVFGEQVFLIPFSTFTSTTLFKQSYKRRL